MGQDRSHYVIGPSYHITSEDMSATEDITAMVQSTSFPGSILFTKRRDPGNEVGMEYKVAVKNKQDFLVSGSLISHKAWHFIPGDLCSVRAHPLHLQTTRSFQLIFIQLKPTVYSTIILPQFCHLQSSKKCRKVRPKFKRQILCQNGRELCTGFRPCHTECRS